MWRLAPGSHEPSMGIGLLNVRAESRHHVQTASWSMRRYGITRSLGGTGDRTGGHARNAGPAGAQQAEPL